MSFISIIFTHMVDFVYDVDETHGEPTHILINDVEISFIGTASVT